MAWQYVNYEYPVAQMFEKHLVWLETDCNMYFAMKLNYEDSWTYYAGNSSHELLSGKILISFVNEADAQSDYITTVKNTDNKFLAILPYTIQAKYVRMYIDDSGSDKSFYEWQPSLKITAHDIVTGDLELTDELSSSPKIKVIADSATKVVMGNLYSNTYGIAGYDTLNGTVFEVSNTETKIGGWEITSSRLTSASSGRRIELNPPENRISIFDDANNEKAVMGYLDGLQKNASPSQTFESDDYGFYAAPGDHLIIDGDTDYEGGDWVVGHDAAFKVVDLNDNTIIKMGTDTGKKGLFIYDNTGTILAEYHSAGFLIGDTTKTGNYIEYTSGNLSMHGAVTISGGSGIASFSDAGDLATEDDVGWSDVTSKPNFGDLATEDEVSAAMCDTTLISGGYLKTTLIEADSITAAMIGVTNLAQIANMELGNTGYIRTTSKDGYTDNTAGIWIGYDSPYYRMNIGDGTHNMKWTGEDLELTGCVVPTSEDFIISGGADLILEGSDSDPGVINFKGTDYEVKMGGDADGDRFFIEPSTKEEIALNLGGNWLTGNVFKNIYLNSSSYTYLSVYGAAAESVIQQGQDFIYLYIDDDDGDTQTLKFVNTAAMNSFYPETTKITDLGLTDHAWDNAYADDWHNVADFYHFDDHDDLVAINGIKGSGIIDDRTGNELIDDDTLPLWLLSKYKKDGEDREESISENGEIVKGKILKTYKKGEVIYDPDNKPYLSFKSCTSLSWGAIRQLDNKVEALTQRIVELEEQIRSK